MRRYATFAILMVLSSLAFSDIDHEVKSMFDSAYSNSTDPGKYKTQAASYYSLGSYSERTPVTDIKLNLINITPPKISAGCGGIDLQNGGFSMIDIDAFVDNLRMVGSNAKSVAFMLGLQLVTPTISDLTNKVNTFQKKYMSLEFSSCEAATALVGGAMELISDDINTCVVRRMEASGDDYSEAKDHCGTGGGQRNTMETGGANKTDFSSGNIAWWHMMQDKFYSENLDYAVLIMNLIGTVIIKYKDDTADSGKLVTILPVAATRDGLTPKGKNIIHSLLNGRQGNTSKLQLKLCSDKLKDKKACLTLGTPEEIDIDWNGLHAYVKDLVVSINKSIRDDTALPSDALAFLSQAPIPIYRYILLERAHSRNKAYSGVDSEIIEKLALNHVYNGVLTAIEVLRNRLGDTEVATSKDVIEYLTTLDVMVNAITKEQEKVVFRINDLQTLSQHMVMLDTEIKKRLSSATVSTMKWGKSK